MANVFQEAPQVVPVENTRVTDNGTSSVGSGADLSSQIWSEMQKTTGDSSANGQLGSTTSSDSNGDSLSQEKVKDSADKTLPSLELFDGQKDTQSGDSPKNSEEKDVPAASEHAEEPDLPVSPKEDLPKDSGRSEPEDTREDKPVPTDTKEDPVITPAPREDQLIIRKS